MLAAAISSQPDEEARYFVARRRVVELIGIEPTTS